jgi:exopolysaccharide biosynthesis polyprenyl glycosylphosphotransferase
VLAGGRDLPGGIETQAVSDITGSWAAAATARRRLLDVPLTVGGRFRRDWLRRRLLAAGDVLAVAAAAVVLRLSHAPDRVVLEVLAFTPGWLLAARICGLYDRDHRALRHLTVDEVPRIFGMVLGGSAALILVLTLAGAPDLTADERLELWASTIGSVFALRAGVRLLCRSLLPPERTLLIGEGELAQAVRRKLELLPDLNVEIVAELDAVAAAGVGEGSPHLRGVERVIVALPAVDEALLARLLHVARLQQLKVSLVPPLRARLGTAVQLTHVSDLPVVEYHTWDTSRTTALAKRLLDVGVSGVLLLVLAPLLLLVAAAIRLADGSPVLFVQERAGFEGRAFRMLKFRTMRCGAHDRVRDVVDLDALPAPMFKLRDDPRVTRLGRVLRSLSLDELPQLLNVLRGDMSLVGPRPEQLDLVARYEPEHRFRLTVKPGLTGPMQVYGRGELDFEERLALERDYVENVSLARDLRLLALTLGSVFRRNGAY